jgi:ABC-2 type transport system permease protein
MTGRWRVFAHLTVASLKMYARQREAVVWSLLLPLLTIILFSFVRFDGLGHLKIGVVNAAGAAGEGLIADFRTVHTWVVTEGSEEDERRALVGGERDLVIVLPAGFGADSAVGLAVLADLEAHPRESQVGTLVLQQLLDARYFRNTPSARRVVVHPTPVTTRNLTYVDFLVPGVVAMTIMQLGVFGVAFGFVSLKRRGVLRRLWVTPIRPGDFIAAQVATRVVVLFVQMTVMLGVGVLFLHLHVVGSLLLLSVAALLGCVVFLSFGFAIAGVAASEDQVAPLANVLTLPMVLLSGVFFSRSSLPDVLRAVTGILPLTYLADALRAIAIDGAGVSDVWPALLGLLVWGCVSVVVAVRLFRWE